jgi:hypothetical protein
MQLHLVHKRHDESGELTQQQPLQQEGRTSRQQLLLAPPLAPAIGAAAVVAGCKAQQRCP